MNIKQIAQIAKVSPATVSLVLNDRPGVSQQTRQKVWQIIKESGYVARRQNGEMGVKGNICFVRYKKEGMVVERNGDFITRVIDGVEFGARKLGYHLTMTNVTNENFADAANKLNHEPIDGIVFLGTEFDFDQLPILNKIRLPIVVLDNQFTHCEYDAVVMDNVDGVFNAIEHLMGLGHKRIGHLKSSLQISNFAQRNFGFVHALEHYNMEDNPAYTFLLGPTLENAFEDMKRHLEEPGCQLPTAFFADNDVIALGAIKALKLKGLRIPQDISVVGFDDLPFGTMMEPPLTTMRILKKRMGQLAVERLAAKIDVPAGEILKILIEPKLVVRESTARV